MTNEFADENALRQKGVAGVGNDVITLRDISL
jgi:hypothetical protein